MVVSQVEVNDINFAPMITGGRAVPTNAIVTKNLRQMYTFSTNIPSPHSSCSLSTPHARGMVRASERKPQEGGRKTPSHDTVHPHEDPRRDQQQRVDRVVEGD